MQLLLNNKTVTFPSSLSEITLGQRINFHIQYGEELEKMRASIIAMEEGVDKEVEAAHFHFEQMFRTFAFFAGTTVDAIKESQFVDTVANIYHSCLATLFEEEENLEVKTSFTWNGEEWTIETPEVHQGSRMKFGEFIDAKQIIKDMGSLGKGKWEAMLPLCAIYLRKKDEPYKKEFVYEGSDRMELMRTLPMDIASQVGFFLTNIIGSYASTLTYSESPEQKVEESIPANTMSGTDG